MQFDDRKIGLAYSMMLSLPGTPVIYYGDEFGKENDHNFYKEMTQMVGKDDTRFLVRGKINWELRETQLNDPKSFQSKVFGHLQQMLQVRSRHMAFGRGTLDFIELKDSQDKVRPEVLAYERKFENEQLLIVQNLSDLAVDLQLPELYYNYTNMFTGEPLMKKRRETGALCLFLVCGIKTHFSFRKT